MQIEGKIKAALAKLSSAGISQPVSILSNKLKKSIKSVEIWG